LLGVQISQVDAGVASRLGLDRIGGVLVDDVRSGGSADRAGLQSGDVVLSIETRSVNAPNELQSAVAHHRPGDWFTMRVWRQRERAVRDFRVELLDRADPVYTEWLTDREIEDPTMTVPDPYPESPEVSGVFDLEDWGIGLSMLDEQGVETFDVGQGVYIAYVRKNSVASRAGLPRDVVVLDVDGVAIDSIDGLLEALELESGHSALFRVRRADGQIAFYEIDVP
jgi:S1-C subfamily serine protease